MKYICLLMLLLALPATAQVTGKITSPNGEAVPFAGITVAGTFIATSSNEKGYYSLPLKQNGNYTIIIRSLGYKTRDIKAAINKFPHQLDITLERESYDLQEVIVSNKDNPADKVIKNAIASKDKNTGRASLFEADFYSRGIFRIKDVPEKILGQELGDLGLGLDSTRSGVIYLSETVSRIRYKRPGKINETVIASKVSGEDNGFSFNNAGAADFDFYNNYLPFEVNVASPVADNAFNYYDYVLESTFFDHENHLINKIRLLPKRNSEPVFSGYIYIVEGSWAIYAADVSITGSQVRQSMLDKLTIRQNYSYNSAENLWMKNVQVIDFDASVFSVDFTGRFSYVYSNYILNPQQFKLSNEVITFSEGSNNKSESFWNSARPIPLTGEEKNDYAKKSRLQELEQSKPYLDSLDRQRNRFNWLSPAIGYTYYNTYKNWDINYSGIIRRLGFNTVQAYNLTPSFCFTKRNPSKNTYYTIGTDLNYGFAEQRFRATGTVTKKFNNFTNLTLTLSGGSSIEQFNPERPINRIVNTISTLFFRDNYMKLYDNNFLRLSYQEEVINGLTLYGSIEYTRRRSLFNNTNFSTIKNARKPYLSNNPLLPFDYDTPAFEKHYLYKASVAARIVFGQQYIKRPDGKFNLPADKYPKLFVKYEKGFASSIENYNFDHLSGRITYDITTGNKGELGINIRAGRFFNSENISFVDYRHFNGNQTHIGKSERYLNVFNFLPYYIHSTNEQYVEAHAEHNFKGFITNKIPLLNKLNYHLVAGYHVLGIPERNPYMEFTIGFDNVGWGKFRFLRIDYIRSYESGFLSDGVIFGLTFLDILE